MTAHLQRGHPCRRRSNLILSLLATRIILADTSHLFFCYITLPLLCFLPFYFFPSFSPFFPFPSLFFFSVYLTVVRVVSDGETRRGRGPSIIPVSCAWPQTAICLHLTLCPLHCCPVYGTHSFQACRYVKVTFKHKTQISHWFLRDFCTLYIWKIEPLQKRKNWD